MSKPLSAVDPRLDLVLDRVLDVPRERVWAAWTTPELLKPWFCPKPWSVSECEIDLRPGGVFRTVMNGPNGEVVPNVGCYLEVVPQERLVWTDALAGGWRPKPSPFMTAILTFAVSGTGTRYRAHVLHADAATREKHETMGFTQGWGTATDQLVAFIQSSTR